MAQALRFYEITLRYAPTPQAKGKIERAHLFWQKRLPALLMAEAIRDLVPANLLLNQLRLHHNRYEDHRELQTTPQSRWDSYVQKIVPFCVPLRPALGGRTSSASAPGSESAGTAASPSGPNDSVWIVLPAFGSSGVFTPMATSRSCSIRPKQALCP